MSKQTELKLVKEGEFLGTKCDFYMDDKQNVYMTREQIGAALQYSNPRVAITKIHSRYKDRLDKFSGVTRLVLPQGGTQDTTIYVTRGIYEICRFSRQPVADQFYDWVYDQIETLRLTAGVIDAERDIQFLDNYFPSMTEETKLMMVKDLQASIKATQQLIESMQPKVENWEAYMDAKGSVTISKLSKSLAIQGLGRNKLFALLRDKKVLQQNNEPYQTYVDKGLFQIRQVLKNGFKFSQTVVTGEGMEWLRVKLPEWGVNVG